MVARKGDVDSMHHAAAFCACAAAVCPSFALSPEMTCELAALSCAVSVVDLCRLCLTSAIPIACNSTWALFQAIAILVIWMQQHSRCLQQRNANACAPYAWSLAIDLLH